MVFAILDSEKPDRIVLVKAGDKLDVEERLHLKETERIVGNFTTSEISVLDTSRFAVVAG